MKYYYCYGITKGLFEDETEYARKKDIYIFYNKEKDTFYDKNNNPINITNKKVFPRAGISEAQILVEAIIRKGGISLVKLEDYDMTLNWPYYIETKRKSIILSGEQIIYNQKLILNTFQSNMVFFKTKQKNFSKIINIFQMLKDNLPFIQTLKEHKDDDFIISEVVTIEKDENGILEYRAFIIDNQIYNISRISNSLLSKIPEEVINRLKAIVNSLKDTNFPKSYVIDLFIYSDKNNNKVVDVLECNPIASSATYLYNSIFEKQEDLEHKCPSATIPEEKRTGDKKKKYNYQVLEYIQPSIFYNLRGGFAADLTSFTLYGTRSSDSYNTNNINISAMKPNQTINNIKQLTKSK